MKTCPRCGKNAHRSQSRGLIEKKVLKPLRIHPYRCRDCRLRFYRFSRHDHRKVRRSDPGIVPNDHSQRRSKKDKSEYQTIVTTLREGEKKAGLAPEVEPDDPEDPADNADEHG